MVAFTENFALPYENPQTSGDQSGVTVHGGVPPIGPADQYILAKRMDAVLGQFTAEDADFEARIAALETAMAASRWRFITEGTQLGGSGVDLIVPAGFKMLRLYVHGDLDAGPNDILLTINNDTANIHNWGFHTLAADGTTVDNVFNAGSNAMRIARWSTTESNSSIVHLMPTDGSANPNIMAIGSRVSTGITGHQWQRGWGKFTADAVVSALQIGRAGGNFATVSWVLEGFLAP